MDQPNDVRQRWQGPAPTGKRLGAAALGVVLVAWLVGFPSGWPVEAQPARPARTEPAARVRMEYRQDQAYWSNMAEVLNKWEARGWETFQIVPVQNPNPGVGGAMLVALVFRRPVK